MITLARTNRLHCSNCHKRIMRGSMIWLHTEEGTVLECLCSNCMIDTAITILVEEDESSGHKV